MPGPRTCGRCGTTLSGPSVRRLCPRCLLRDAIEFAESPACGTTADHVQEIPPRCFGDYELLDTLGRGGMGIVFKARQISLNRTVALKMILAEQFASEAEVRRFHVEAEAAASLEHPNIVPIHEVGTCEGQHYFSMKLMEGGSLAGQMRRFVGSPRSAVRLLISVAQAVHHAHQHGILHRDLKPANILLDGNDQPYVSDFGLARRASEDASLALSGQLLGTPAYMAPEQAAGKIRQVSMTADIYSLGAILYELLTGQPPYSGATPLETLEQVRDLPPRRPSAISRRVDRNLEIICLKCLAKDPQRRYRSALELAEDLQRWLDGRTILARPSGRTEKLWRWCRRRPLVAGLGAALVVVFMAGFAGVVWQWRRAVAEGLISRQNAYTADMVLVQQVLEEGDVGQARMLLDRNRPRAGEADLRGWEWRYRWQQCQTDPALIRKLPPYTRKVESVVFSSDGKYLAATANDGWVGTIDLRSPVSQWQTLLHHGAATDRNSVAFLPNENVLAFSDGKAIRLWSIAEAREVASLTDTAEQAEVSTVAISADGAMLAAFTSNQKVKVWDLKLRKLIGQIKANKMLSLRSALAFSPRGDCLAFGEMAGEVRLAAVPACTPIRSMFAPPEMVARLAFSPDGKFLATSSCATDRTVRLWEVETGSLVRTLDGHKRYVLAVTFSPDGRLLASAGADQSIRLWQMPDGVEKRILRGHELEVWAVAFAPDGRTLATGCKDGSVWLWDTAIDRAPDPLIRDDLRVRWDGFLPDGSLAVTDKSGSEWSGWVYLLDAVDLRSKARLDPLRKDNFAVAPSPDGKLLAVGGTDGRFRIWDLRENRIVAEQQGCPSPDCVGYGLVCALFSRDGKRLWTVSFVSGKPAHVTARQMPTLKVLGHHALPGIKADWGDISPDGSLVASAGERLEVWNVDRKRVALDVRHKTDASAVAFSPDGKILACGTEGAEIILYDTQSWKPLRPPLRAHQLAVCWLSFSPDGRRLLSTGGSGEEAVVLWDVGTWRQVANLHGRGNLFRGAWFSPDGNSIVTRSGEGDLHLWRAPSMEQIEAAERGGRGQAGR